MCCKQILAFQPNVSWSRYVHVIHTGIWQNRNSGHEYQIRKEESNEMKTKKRTNKQKPVKIFVKTHVLRRQFLCVYVCNWDFVSNLRRNANMQIFFTFHNERGDPRLPRVISTLPSLSVEHPKWPIVTSCSRSSVLSHITCSVFARHNF